MNTPGYDPGLADRPRRRRRANLIAFTTGRGSAIGFPTVPVIKIASNSHTFRAMRDNMDVNAGSIADGERTIDQVGREIFDMMLARGFRPADVRRAPGPPGIRPLADRAGDVGGARFSLPSILSSPHRCGAPL
jgi:hypothetical protein